MNKNLPEAITQLAVRLVQAAEAQDWQQLTALDSEVQSLLERMATVPAPLPPALAKLQLAHQRALKLSCDHAAVLQHRISSLRDNREGLRAYAQTGDTL